MRHNTGAGFKNKASNRGLEFNNSLHIKYFRNSSTYIQFLRMYSEYNIWGSIQDFCTFLTIPKSNTYPKSLGSYRTPRSK